MMTQVSKNCSGKKSAAAEVVTPDVAASAETSASRRSGEIDRLFPTGLFRALSDANRIALLGKLATSCGALTVSEAAGCCPTDLSVTSRHLAILRDAGIIEARKQGRQVFYSVRYQKLSTSLRQMADAIDACCPASGEAELVGEPEMKSTEEV